MNGMIYEQALIDNIHKLHTTPLGAERIKRNLNINEDPVAFCTRMITDENSVIFRKGKNWYCRCGSIEITVNAHSYTIITAHIIKSKEGDSHASASSI